MELVKGGGGSVPENNWKNRRSQKLEKMELLNLQSNLNSEIQVGTKIKHRNDIYGFSFGI